LIQVENNKNQFILSVEYTKKWKFIKKNKTINSSCCHPN